MFIASPSPPPSHHLIEVVKDPRKSKLSTCYLHVSNDYSLTDCDEL